MILLQRRDWRTLVCVFSSAFIALEAAAAEGRSSAQLQPIRVEHADQPTLADELATDVGHIANSSTIARAKKEKLISAAVREAVLISTGYLNEPKILGVALELTTAAAQAAPPFAEVIARAVSFAPPVAKINAAPRIRTAAYAAAKGPRSPERAGQDGSLADGTRITRHSPSEMNLDDRARGLSGFRLTPKIQFGDNSSVTLTAAVGVSHDSNILLENGNVLTGGEEDVETITSFTPGAAFRFGHNSLAHGSVAYKVAFTRYAHLKPRTSKQGIGSADFGYNSGVLAIDAAATYQQSEQATVGTVIANRNTGTLIRQNVLTLAANVEPTLTAKTSVQAGVAIDWTEYKLAGLIGSKNITIPVKVHFEATPKLDVSAGVSYNQAKPQGGGPNGQDLFYNVGLRGNLSEKFTSNFSVGYRSRKVADRYSDGLWGFDGSLNYQVTSKSDLSLVSSRNFSIGSAGESLKSSSYFLNFATSPTLQWQFSGAIGYRGTDYGPDVFKVTPRLPPPPSQTPPFRVAKQIPIGKAI